MGCSGEVIVPVYADHRGIVKYSSPSDAKYLSSRNSLRRITFNAARQPLLARKEHKIIRAFLGFTDTTAQKYEGLLQSWVSETCEWILEEGSSLTSWFHNQPRYPTLFWLYGPPETGKSVLSAAIARHIVLYDVGHCSYFHMEAGLPISTSLDVVLKSFAYYLSLHVPSFRHALAEIARQKRYLSDSSWEKIWELIVSLSDKILAEGPIYWIIDGIDHCPGEERDRNLRRQPSGAKGAPPTADAVGTGLSGRMPRPDPAACGQRHSDRTQVDPCAPRSARQRDRGSTREKSGPGIGQATESFQQVYSSRGRSQTPNPQGGEARVGDHVGEGDNQSTDKTLD